MGTAKRKIIVGMSGGVDSSVAAALLCREGHEVVGAFMKNWSDAKDPATGVCAWRKERDDAAAVAERLGIPLLTLDFEKEYREGVVGYMVREYASGRTPNPDVMCNSLVKFDLFLARALELGADAVATGHYARVEGAPGERRLLRGADPNKDQSYFLHRLTQPQLARAEFPVGGMRKDEVRAVARDLGLATAAKKDSQGICFVGDVRLPEFLAARIPGRRGPVIDERGDVVGVHAGAAPFTIGQRHGLGLGGGTPYFVTDKDMRRNAVYVARGEDPASLYSGALVASAPHWIAGAPPPLPFACRARIRYRQELQDAVVSACDGGVRVAFGRPQRAVTPGQFAVFYDGDACIGGAVIEGRD